MRRLWMDLHFAGRMFARYPGFYAIALITLAFGIGANTTIFSVVNALLIKPLPFYEPERLVQVSQASPSPKQPEGMVYWSFPHFTALREASPCFENVAAFVEQPFNLTGADGAERVRVELVSQSYFPVLGVQAAVGRTFLPEEDQTPGSHPVAMISHALWQRRFGGVPEAIHKTLELEQKAFTIVGILPAGFKGQYGTVDVWIPTQMAPVLRYPKILANPNNSWLQVIARLKPGLSLSQAQSALVSTKNHLDQVFPASEPDSTATMGIIPLHQTKVDPQLKLSLLILMAAVGCVLLIVCANTANLFLVRVVERQKEIALRLMLGASRLQLVRQFLTESIILSLIGGSLALVVATWGIDLLLAFKPTDEEQFWTVYARIFDLFSIRLEPTVLLFNFAISAVTGGLVGLVAAFRISITNPLQSLKSSDYSFRFQLTHFASVSRVNLRTMLVIGEIAISVVLLVGTGLMIRSLLQLQAVKLGFSPNQVLIVQLPSRNAGLEFYEPVVTKVSSLPGVEAVGLGSSAPLMGYSSLTQMTLEGQSDSGQGAIIGFHSVSPGYFQSLQIPVVTGRAFTTQDRIGAPRVAIINRTAAERYFPGTDPLHKRIHPMIEAEYPGAGEMVEIVGVVEDVRYGRLEEKIGPDVYLSAWQPTDPAQTLVIKASGDPRLLATAIRNEIKQLNPNVPLANFQTLEERTAEVTSRTRFIALVLGVFAAVAAFLAALGVYGVLTFSISARTREIGTYLALGAQPRDILQMVATEGAVLIGLGLVLGVFGALGSLHILQSQLFEISTTDPVTVMGVTGLLAITGLLACLIPAYRATQIDPMMALRHE
ncbi:MAG: ABC transporter permease [Acidobacteria bacterium]|nr:ABC transporter permease [Acidobacteriota bacterium]